MYNIQYYVSHGSKTMMYTLRIRYSAKVWCSAAQQNIIADFDYYVCNLSTDADLAIEKAKAYVKERGEAGAVYANNTLEPLEDIKRRHSEEVQAAIAAKEAEYEAQEIAKRNSHIQVILSGYFPFGRFKDQKFDAAPVSYIMYWLNSDAGDDAVASTLQTVLAAKYPHLVNMPKPNGKYYGDEKQRGELTATLIESYGFDGYFGYTYIDKLVKDTGELLVYMGGASKFCDDDLGKQVQFTATVKCHEDYEGERQTKILRIKRVD